ncbi:hypothetical protein PAXRUDRAFT_58258, partial [Paxillus rubicundulus Ve08.2h10]
PMHVPMNIPTHITKGKQNEISGSSISNTPPASWSDKDVTVLVDLALKQKAEAGEGMNYK